MTAVRPFWVLLAALASASGPLDLGGHVRDPFAAAARARVFLFVRSDCPVTNRYAPELQRIAQEFAGRGVEFWLVYPDPAETAETIRKHLSEYHFPGEPLRDPQHRLVRHAHATIAPEAAVFDASGSVAYLGRIDDRFVDFGKSRPAPRTHDLEAAISAVLAGKPVAQPQTHAIGCYLADVK